MRAAARGLLAALALAAAPAPSAPAPTASPAPAPAPSPAARELQRARVLLEDKKRLDALDVLLDALARYPDSPEVRVRLAEVSASLYEEERRRGLTPEELKAAVAEAKDAVRAGLDETAGMRRQLDLIRKGLEGGSSAASLLGASRELGRLDRRKVEDEVLRQDMARYLRLLQERLRAAMARGDFTQPKDQLVARGFLWYYKDDLAQALRLWRQALELDPGDVSLSEQAAWVERRLKLLQRRDTIDKLLKLAKTLYEQGRDEEALAQARALKLLEPEDDDVRMELDILEQKIERRELRSRVERARRAGMSRDPLRAAQAWLAVLELDPSHAEAKEELRGIQDKLVSSAPPAPRRSRRRAAEEAAPASPAAAAPAEPAPRSTAEAERSYALGLIYYQQNDLAAAKRAMEAALRLDPQLKPARASLERINSELGAP